MGPFLTPRRTLDTSDLKINLFGSPSLIGDQLKYIFSLEVYVIVCPLPPLNNFLIAPLLFLDMQKFNMSEKFLVLSSTLNPKNNFRRKLSLLKLTSPANLTRGKK